MDLILDQSNAAPLSARTEGLGSRRVAISLGLDRADTAPDTPATGPQLVGLGEEGDLGGCNSADKRKRAHVVRAVVILT
jgi:hypothetical protein